MKIMGKKRAVIGSSGVIDVSECVAITINNEHIVPVYKPEIDVDPVLQELIQQAKDTGATAVNMKGLKGKTTYFVSIDNLLPEILSLLMSKKDKVWVDGLERFNLYAEVPADSNCKYYSKDFSKGLVKVEEDWDTIKDITFDLFYDKYLTAKLEDYEITAEEIDAMTVTELDSLIANIETAKEIDLITSSLNKAEKVDLIKSTLGIIEQEAE
jgi:hypothetical protein